MTALNNIDQTINLLSPIFQQYPLLMKEWHECAADRADVAFIFEKITKLPEPLAKVLLANAFKLKQRRERNLYILRTSNFILNLLPERLKGSLTVEDGEIRNIANDCAERCRRIALTHNVKGRLKAKQSDPLTKQDVNGLERLVPSHFDALTEISVTNSDEIFQVLSGELKFYGVQGFVLNSGDVTAIGAIRRMCDKHWWTRKLRKIFNQAYEKAAIELGLVNKYKQIYASDLTVKKRRQQLYANEQLMSSSSVNNCTLYY